MAILIGILTAALVVLCLFLILLVLVQLPKKEAGASMAFGGGAADALLGAGSGSDIARFTGYVAGAFFVLTLTLSLLRAHEVTAKNSAVADALRNASGKRATTLPAPLVSTNLLQTTRSTNLPAPAAPAPSAIAPAPAPVPTAGMSAATNANPSAKK